MPTFTFCAAKTQVCLRVTEFHGATVLVKRKAELTRRGVMSSLSQYGLNAALFGTEGD